MTNSTHPCQSSNGNLKARNVKDAIASPPKVIVNVVTLSSAVLAISSSFVTFAWSLVMLLSCFIAGCWCLAVEIKRLRSSGIFKANAKGHAPGEKGTTNE